MNDPGLDGPIADASKVANEQHDGRDADSNMDEEEEEKNFLLPAKWWYASTAFPLMAGTFGPMANAFSICALVENWRVKVPKGGTEEHGIDIKDPKWLIAVNAVSLAFALIANMSLLLNMARRLSFRWAQPITILGFWMASILLIGLIVKAAHDFHAPDVRDQALTQAYYYAVFAAGLYQIISYLMVVTAWGAWMGHFSKEFKLTMAQRTLMLQTISYLMYLLLGALVYSKIEGWKFLDAVYWADFTTLTIGIGDDYTPKTHLGRSLLFPFAMGGIIMLGLVVGSIRSLVLDRSKKKMGARITEKTRRRVVKRVSAATENSKKKVAGLDKHTATILVEGFKEEKVSEMQRRKAEFVAMRRVQEMAEDEQKWLSLGTSTLSFTFLWFIGALIFKFSEHNQDWSYFESLYFSYTTLLTIGYGDFQPISNSGKPFFVFWSLLAIPTLTILISDMGDTVVKGIKDLTIWLGEITVLPSDEGGLLDRLKYGLYKVTLGRINFENTGPTPEDDPEMDEDMRRFQEMNPGLIKMPPREEPRHRRHKHHDLEGGELADDFVKSEKEDERKARERGDDIAEDDHHYRHILISQIRKVWNDTSQATPKKYSYAEWAYYLRLLGEDENDPRFHRKAPVKRVDSSKPDKDQAAQAKQDYEHGGQKDVHVQPGLGGAESEKGEGLKHVREDGKEGVGSGTGGGVTRWSWIGTRSPLMGDKEESEWLLEKLFQRLEESLKDHWQEHQAEKEGDEKRGSSGSWGRGTGYAGSRDSKDEDRRRQAEENRDDGRVRDPDGKKHERKMSGSGEETLGDDDNDNEDVDDRGVDEDHAQEKTKAQAERLEPRESADMTGEESGPDRGQDQGQEQEMAPNGLDQRPAL